MEGTILAGMMITQLGGVVMQYYRMRLMDDETGLLELYQMLTSGDLIYQDTASMIIFLGLTTLCLLPMIILGYRFNSVAFDDMEMKAMGISNGRMRGLGLLSTS